MIYTIVYEGPIVSNNAFYAGMHWTKRNDLKNNYNIIFSNLLTKAKVKPFKQFRLNVRFNSKHDCDNVVATLKIFVDTLKGKYVENDTKEFFTGFSVEHDDTLKKNTMVFQIDTNGNQTEIN